METCNQCGAERVLNPKTNKMFCKEKCWLKGQQLKANAKSSNSAAVASFTKIGEILTREHFDKRMDALEDELKKAFGDLPEPEFED